MTRRQVLRTGGAALAGGLVVPGPFGEGRHPAPPPGTRIPLVHLTDLYHPPQDPDDQVDLATAVALDAFDLKGVVLDVTRRFLEAAPEGFDVARDPGFAPVVQLGYVTGRSLPVAIGPTEPLQGPGDDARGRPAHEQAGIELLLDVLRGSDQPVVISLVGSARVLTAAYNREPALVRARTRAVLLNAGFTAGTRREWNVDLDVAAYVGLWRSGLPLHWYPCATERGAFDPAHERGTFWRATHADLFRDLPAPLRAWFAYGFSGSARGDLIRALDDVGQGSVWDTLLGGTRNLWATASLAMAAGRVLARTAAGWRFVPAAGADGLETWPWHLDPINATADDDGTVRWDLAARQGPPYLFARRPGAAYGAAMTEALNALLRAFPLARPSTSPPR